MQKQQQLINKKWSINVEYIQGANCIKSKDLIIMEQPVLLRKMEY